MLTATVATFNLRHGRGLDDRVDLERTADVISRIGADLISLQELDRSHPRSGRVDQPAELERLIGLPVHFCPTIAGDGWEYGIALAGRDISRISHLDLPQRGREEPRRAISAMWRGTRVLATHLALDARSNDRQQRALARAIEDASRSLVLGDLNRSGRRLSPHLRTRLEPALARRATLHPWWRFRQIDHVLVGDAISIERIRTVPTDASDHRPLAVDLQLPVEDVSRVTYDV